MFQSNYKLGASVVLASLFATIAHAGPADSCFTDQDQPSDGGCMASFFQVDIAQSFVPDRPTLCGASLKFTTAGGPGGEATIELWDALPNAGGTMLASGTGWAAPDSWMDVSWPAVTVTPGNTYYLVFTGPESCPCIAGDPDDPYPDGNAFFNSGYGAYVNYDFTFSTGTRTLLYQPPIGGGLFTADCDSPEGIVQWLADQVVLSEPAVIRTVRTWGAMYGDNDVPPTDFRVDVYEGATQGALSWTATVAGDVQATGAMIGALIEYQVTLDIATPLLPAGTHWISVSANTIDSSDGWGWEVGALDPQASEPEFYYTQPPNCESTPSWWANANLGVELALELETGPPPPCPADLDGDGVVGFSDLVAVLSAWGPCNDPAGCPADLDLDGNVGFGDLVIVLSAWGPCA